MHAHTRDIFSRNATVCVEHDSFVCTIGLPLGGMAHMMWWDQETHSEDKKRYSIIRECTKGHSDILQVTVIYCRSHGRATLLAYIRKYMT